MATTDKGANEVYAQKAIQVQMRDVNTFFYLPSDCLEHLAHLGVLGGLKLCDTLLKGYRPWKFFSSIAIIANTLRDLSQSLFATWRELFGDVSAVEKVKSLFPRCIAGRWGSINETERRLLKAGIPQLAQAFRAMFTADPDLLCVDGESQDGPLTDGAIDTLSLEETHVFKVRMGKWRRHAFEVLQDKLFDRLTSVMNETRQPWMHLSHFLKKKAVDPNSSELHLRSLVCGKAQALQDEFTTMIFRCLP